MFLLTTTFLHRKMSYILMRITHLNSSRLRLPRFGLPPPLFTDVVQTTRVFRTSLHHIEFLALFTQSIYKCHLGNLHEHVSAK
jgi:hypothetical protein